MSNAGDFTIQASDTMGDSEVWIEHTVCENTSDWFETPLAMAEVLGWMDDHERECKA